MELLTLSLPAYWASALINNDYSGLEDSDIEDVQNFLNKDRGNATPTRFWCIECSEESYFGQYNGMGCDMLDYTFDVSPTD